MGDDYFCEMFKTREQITEIKPMRIPVEMANV